MATKTKPKAKPVEKQKRGPKAEVLKLNGSWVAAIGKSLQKKRPESGWPKV